MADFGPLDGWTDRNGDVFWWTKKSKNDIHQSIQADFSHLVVDNQRQELYETYASLYRNRRLDPGGPILGAYEAEWTVSRGKYTRAPYPLMKQVIDEVTARLVRSHPRARFMTHGGSRKLQRRAELMERWNDHLMHSLHEEKLLDLCILDACIFGLGAIKFMAAPQENKVVAERCYPGNLFVDLQETIFNKPTRLHQRRFVSRKALAHHFPNQKKMIEKAGMVSDTSRFSSYYGHYQATAHDMCEVIESWHLPSFVDKKGKSPDGKRVLWIDQGVLQVSDYNRREFPFAFFQWKDDPHNRFYGIGLAEDLLGIHVDCNVTLRRVNTAIEFLPNPYVLVRKGSKVNAADISNAPGTIIEYSGNEPPQIVMPPTVPGDLLSYVREHEMRAYKVAGLSGAQSQGAVPSGLETGRAVESYFQVESVPFSTQLKKFERFVEAVAENNVATGRELYDRDPSFTVVLQEDKHTISELNWKEVSIDPRQDSYVIRSSPTSALSETPAARLGEVERLSAMFPNMPEAVKRDLLNMPDLEAENDLAAAQLHNIRAMIGQALDHNIYTPPSPFMDLMLFVIEANNAEQRAQEMNTPEPNVATLRRMILRANEMVQGQQRAAMVQQQGMMTPAVVPQDPASGQPPTAITE